MRERATRGVVLGLAIALVVSFGVAGALAASPGGTNPPSVTGVSPQRGPIRGGTTVTIRGAGLGSAVGVAFGGQPAASFHVVSDGEIMAVAPPGRGLVDVIVVTRGGISRPSKGDSYAYGGARPTANDSLAVGSDVAMPTRVALSLTPRAPLNSMEQAKQAAARLFGRWCPLSFVGPTPVAPLMCALDAFVPATAIWHEATQTAVVYVGSDRLSVGIGASTAQLVTPDRTVSIPVDPPAALVPQGVTAVPLGFLARALGGRARWDAAAQTAMVQATTHDPGMARAAALAAVLRPYPGSASSDVPETPVAGIGVRFLRDAFREWVAADTASQTWDESEASRLGFRRNAVIGGAGGGTLCEVAPPRQLPQVQVGTSPLSKGKTVVRYDALVVDTPTRPASGPVAPGADRVTVTRESTDGPLGTPTVLTDLALIARLTSIADGLPVAVGGTNYGCGALMRPNSLTDVRFDFAYPRSAGKPSVSLREVLDCGSPSVVVGIPGEVYPALSDRSESLVSAAS